ncbi:MAG: alpha/beta hydrolase family protein [Granulosicoccaceae bacterium]
MKTSSLAVSLLAGVCSLGVSASPVGVSQTQVFAAERDRDIELVLWYPAGTGGQPVSLGENGLFYGTPAVQGAAVAEGKYPLVVISHGGGGNGAQFGWLANTLVEQGFVVAAPNHPGSTTGDSSAHEAVKVWLRAADVSAVLDGISGEHALAASVDLERVGVFGFSAGGYTALAVAGARVDEQVLRGFCDESSKTLSDCAFLQRGGVDLHQVDLTSAGRSNADERVDAVFAVDPGIATALTAQSLAEIELPVALLNMGEADRVPAALDASTAAQVIQGVQFSRIEDGHHFSLLPRCKPAGPVILKEEGELDPLCDDVEGGRPRVELHRQIARQVSRFFDEVL